MRDASIASVGTTRATQTDAEARLAALARAQAPLRGALARIAARLVSRRAWERLGFARLADYARERTGLSARQVQDLAHVAERLAELPAVEATFLGGDLSWSKARLLCRVAESADEARWVAFARTVSVRRLEREVRAIDLASVEGGALATASAETDEDGAPTEPRAGVVVRCTPAVRAKFRRARQLARRAAGESLPVWACMEAVAAEALSALPGPFVDAEEARGRTAGVANVCAEQAAGDGIQTVDSGLHSAADAGAHPAANVCATHAFSTEANPFLVGLLTDLDAADAFELDARLRRCVALEQRLEAEMAPLLLVVARTRAFRFRGFTSLEAYARERLGMSPRKARALLRLARSSERCPELLDAFTVGAISWVQANLLLPLLQTPACDAWCGAWIQWAQRVAVRRLDDDVEAAVQLLETDPEAFAASGGLPERQTCARDTDPSGTAEPARSELETAHFFFTAPADVARLFRAVVCSVRRALERSLGRPATNGDAVGWMFDHAFATWGVDDRRVPRAHRVFARDGWRCTVPGCSSYRNLHDHHVTFRSAGGSDALANRTTLCAWHHLRGVHAGLVRCSGSAPEGLRFELGIRRGLPPLLRFRSRDLRVA